MYAIYTIGYEGTDIERFVLTLKTVGIKQLADVRAVAISRKKGFSKTALRSRLEAEGIAYSHHVELGDPKPGREAARAGHHSLFQAIYTKHLKSPEALSELENLASLIAVKPTCLLCFERDPLGCHRTIIATRLTLSGLKIVNLVGDDPARYDCSASKRKSAHSRQGVASTEQATR